MASSGSIDFNQTKSEIIKDAMLDCGAIAAGETPDADESADVSRALNRMVKGWHTQGIHLWTWRELTLFLVKSQVQYALGTGGDHATLTAVKTELAADAATSATSLTVDSITGISAGDNIGVELDDGTLHWDTQSGSPSSSTLTLTTGLASAASTDNHVYAYTTLIDRPLRITNVRRRDEAGNDIPILTFSREEYFDTPNKSAQSATTQVYYDPKLTNGQMYLWPAPNTVRDRILADGAFPIEDFDAAGDNPDFPQEWLNALVKNLAFNIANQFSTPDNLYLRIKSEAFETLEAVKDWDQEPEDTYFQPEPEFG